MQIPPLHPVADAIHATASDHASVETPPSSPTAASPAPRIVRLAEPVSPSRLYYRLGQRQPKDDDLSPEPRPSSTPVRAPLTPAERQALLAYSSGAKHEINAYLRLQASRRGSRSRDDGTP